MNINTIIEIEFMLADLPKLAQTLLPYIQQYKIVAFHGEMGAGKTTVIKTLCKIAGVQEMVNSPTFAIINEYTSRYGTIFHMDLYRLKDEIEAQGAGVEDALYSGAICFVEWPEKAATLLPNHHLNIYLSVIGKGKRKIICAS